MLGRDQVDDTLARRYALDVGNRVEPLPNYQRARKATRDVGSKVMHPQDTSYDAIDLDDEAVDQEVVLYPSLERNSVDGTPLSQSGCDVEVLDVELRSVMNHVARAGPDVERCAFSL
jgi:hypothetical protein